MGISSGEGKKGTTGGKDGSFAKTCFGASVGVWSAKKGGKTGFSLVLLDFLERMPGAHNPEAVGSSPTSATIKPPFSPRKRWFF